MNKYDKAILVIIAIFNIVVIGSIIFIGILGATSFAAGQIASAIVCCITFMIQNAMGIGFNIFFIRQGYVSIREKNKDKELNSSFICKLNGEDISIDEIRKQILQQSQQYANSQYNSETNETTGIRYTIE